VAAIKPIRTLLATACALAGIHAETSQAVEAESALMVYSEANRVTALEPVLKITNALTDMRTLSFKMVLDGLTGASPNGAVPSTRPQTFTSPSGSSSYTATPNTTPLDNAFTDNRVEVDLSLEQRYGLLTRASYGLHGSIERDYGSLGTDFVFKREFDRRNRMLSLGLSLGMDSVRPVGGPPAPLTEMIAPVNQEGEEGAGAPGKTKRTADLLAGFTQIVDRRTVAQVNYSASRSSGYLTDPYKFVSVVAPEGDADAGEPLRQIYESRPDSRLKQSLFAELRRHLGRDILDLSYRYLWDDWDLRSHTAELSYLLRYRRGNSLEPNLRWYRQNAVSFYRHSLVDGQPLPDYASADPRLTAFDAWTFGLKWRHSLPDGREVSFRGAYYLQRGENHPADAVGQLRRQDLFPNLDAFIFEIAYRFDLLLQ